MKRDEWQIIVMILVGLILISMLIEYREFKRYKKACGMAMEACFNTTDISILDCRVCAICVPFCQDVSKEWLK